MKNIKINFPYLTFISYSIFCVIKFIDSGILLNLMLAVMYLLVSLSYTVQTKATSKDIRYTTLAITFTHLSLPMFLSTDGTTVVHPTIIYALATGGILLSSLSILELWGSFGILPATRKIKTSGPYKYVRHPIYLGYLITALGWTLYSLSIANISVLSILTVLTLLRIKLEEDILTKDDSYAAYKTAVSSKIIPGLL